MTHGSQAVSEGSRKSSVKDVLFLRRAESEWVEEGGGRVVFCGVDPETPPHAEPEKDVERTGELGQRKMPGLCLTD